MKKYNEIITKELNRILPYHLLGIVGQSIALYLLFKIPEITGNILDLLMQEYINKELIMQQAYLLIFYSLILFIPRSLYRKLYFTISRKSDTILRKKVIEHLQTVKPEYFEKENKGTFLAYITQELLNIRKVLGNFWFWTTRMFITPIIAIIMIWNQLNFKLALWIIPIFPITIIVMYHFYKQLKEKIETARKVKIEFSKNIERNTEGFLLIKSYNQQEIQKQEFQEINQKMYQADYSIGISKNRISNVINILYALCYIITFSMGTIYIQNGELTVGELTAFIGYIGIALSNFIPSIQSMLERMPYWTQSLNRFNYFLNLEKCPKEGENIDEIKTIQINNLSYWYDNTEEPALKEINLTIKNGEKIGIIGEVGSGKTTLMNIISGFYEIPDNMVFINGKDINKYKRSDIFRKINYAIQQNIILDDSIKSNIDILENLEKEEIDKIIQKAELQEDIQKLENKEHTFVGEKGIKLSGGQKQRISIARNIANIRDVNIFDDTLSALDSNTETKIMNTLIDIIKDNILIVISNKVSNIKYLDKIYVMLNGRIEDCGTHQELLQRNKFYRELELLERKEENDERYCKE